MSVTLSHRFREWIDHVHTSHIMSFAASLPVNTSFTNVSTTPCLRITRWGTKVTTALETSDVRRQRNVSQAGTFQHEDFKYGALLVVYVDNSVKTEKLIGLPKYTFQMRRITMSLMEDEQKLSQANDMVQETLVKSLIWFLHGV